MAVEKALPPLSSTVSAVFDQFINKLKEDNVLGKSAIEALSENLHGQKFGSDALRAAIFKADEPAQ
jgi:hypothetical protein